MTMEEALYNLIDEMIKERESKKIVPSQILYSELEQKIRDTLNTMHKKGLIKGGETLNGHYIQILKR